VKKLPMTVSSRTSSPSGRRGFPHRKWIWNTLACLRRLYVIALIFSIANNLANAALIDDFEREDFSIAAPANSSELSSHSAVDPTHVIGGDRDVWTLAYDDVGSQTNLVTSDGDNGAVVTANSVGTIYWVMFQYDGPGTNSLNLNADLTAEGHDAVLVEITDISLALPATIEVFVISNWEEPTESLGSLVLPVNSSGILSFPFSSFSQNNGILDFSQVDSIAVIVKLQTSSSITISEIRMGLVPEPSTAALLLIVGIPIFARRRTRRV